MRVETTRIAIFAAMVALSLAAQPAVAEDASDLAGRAATWVAAYNSDDLEAVAAMYAEDGCRMPPNAETVTGREAILAFLAEGKAQGLETVSVSVTEAGTSGDWGWGRGTYEITAADGSHLDHGVWMNVSRKVDDAWMIHCDIWNSDMPLPE